MYVSTYRNKCGEQSVFVQHQCQPWPLMILGDDLVPEPIELCGPPVHNPGRFPTHSVPALVVGGCVLENGERLWLTACWEASQDLRDEYQRRLAKTG